jgi:hypothetical protein
MEKADYQGPERSVLYTIPVDLTLTDDGLLVDIDSAQILGPTKQRLYSIGVYRGLGATNAQNGNEYMIVPDGSGAVIPVNGKLTTDAYKARLYGNDETFAKTMDNDLSEQALAGYLIYDRSVEKADATTLNAGGVIALMEEGAGQTTAVARPISGSSNTVCSINYEIIYSERDYRTYSTSSKGTDQSGSGLLLSKEAVTGNYRIHYLFTKGGLTYSDYAKLLRDYYIRQGVLPSESVDKTELPFYVDLLGCFDLEETVAGIPVMEKTPLTSYSQTLQILTKLKDAGVNNVVARYTDWSNGGENNVAANDLELIPNMGSKSELQSLIQYCADNNIGFYPSVDFLYVSSPGNGFSKSEDALLSLRLLSHRYPLKNHTCIQGNSHRACRLHR